MGKVINLQLPKDKPFIENDLMEVIRNEGGDIIERVECIDVYISEKLQAESRCYRIYYRSLVETLQNSDIDKIQLNIRESILKNLNINQVLNN